MKICFNIGWRKEKKPKPPELSEKWYVEMYEIGGVSKPRFIVTDKNMYSEGYLQAGRVGGCKRWELEDIYECECDRVLVEVRKGKPKTIKLLLRSVKTRVAWRAGKAQLN